MNGASLSEISEVLGHKTLQMVKRYAHLSEAHTSKVVAKMNEKIFNKINHCVSTSDHEQKKSSLLANSLNEFNLYTIKLPLKNN